MFLREQHDIAVSTAIKMIDRYRKSPFRIPKNCINCTYNVETIKRQQIPIVVRSVGCRFYRMPTVVGHVGKLAF